MQLRENWVSPGLVDPLEKAMATIPVLLPENPADGGVLAGLQAMVAKSQT